MLYSGEDVGDAAIKTGGHLLIQLALGAVGGPIGFFAGDVWDGTKNVVGDTMKSVGDTAEKIWDSAGDAVNGFLSGLGSVFNNKEKKLCIIINLCLV